jgi:transcriptional regulator with XRE-family HTH domain
MMRQEARRQAYELELTGIDQQWAEEIRQQDAARQTTVLGVEYSSISAAIKAHNLKQNTVFVRMKRKKETAAQAIEHLIQHPADLGAFERQGSKKDRSMTLTDYLIKNKISPEKFAAQVGVAPSTIYRLLGGVTIPKRQNLKKILEATNGEVGVNELLAFAVRDDVKQEEQDHHPDIPQRSVSL